MALGRRCKTWDDEVVIPLTSTNIKEALEILRFILILAILCVFLFFFFFFFAAMWPISTLIHIHPRVHFGTL